MHGYIRIYMCIYIYVYIYGNISKSDHGDLLINIQPHMVEAEYVLT